jgi:microcystin-dependent protein
VALTFFETARFKLRALKGSNLVSDIDAGFEALANDVDKLVYPPGDLRFTARVALDTGWLRCEGQAVSRAANAALFAAISTSYGIGDGSTTFNVPDYRGRLPIGAGAGPGLTARTLGQVLGEETHKLTVGEMPSHSHTFAGAQVVPENQIGATHENLAGSATTATGNTGGDGAHNNIQPSTVCNIWIKT